MAVKGLESGNGRIWDGCFGRYCPLAGDDEAGDDRLLTLIENI